MLVNTEFEFDGTMPNPGAAKSLKRNIVPVILGATPVVLGMLCVVNAENTLYGRVGGVIDEYDWTSNVDGLYVRNDETFSPIFMDRTGLMKNPPVVGFTAPAPPASITTELEL